jgi:hypothetical protein
MSKSVLERILHGDLLGPDEIGRALDDGIAEWHASENTHKSLAAYLGFHDDEYAAWAECHDSLWLILRARRDGVSLAKVIRKYGKARPSEARLAARGAKPDERERILDWLRRSRRVSGSR